MFEWFDKNIFNHVGRTIQKYAIISLIIDVVACIILAYIVGYAFVAFIILLCGFGYAIIFAFPIYAFGQLVEDIHRTQENTSKIDNVINTDELPEL